MSCLGMPFYEDGFRLVGPASECSLKSKARIDALFEDSKSTYGSTMGGWYGGVSTVTSYNLGEIGVDEQKRVNSAVQARIEAMFASVEAESGTRGECTTAILPVKYMGAAPVGGRVASVKGLQEPLHQLLKHVNSSVRAELEVSRQGLTFRTADRDEKTNPFRRIAVWSALKLCSKKTSSGELHHAFLPLVGDHERRQTGEEKHADLYRTMRGLNIVTEHYPPIFAVVMRSPGANRVLECHAFSCESEEDAVAAAATLYRALLADLDATQRRPRHTNGVGCVSLTSVVSSIRESSSNNKINNRLKTLQAKDVWLPSSHPVRPPRSKKTSACSSLTEDKVTQPQELTKASRKKKKNSDVKAEDILEARERGRESIPKQNVSPGIEDFSFTEKNLDSIGLKKEECKIAKNIVSSKEILSVSGKIEIDKSSRQGNDIYDIGVNEFYETVSNRYEKLPVTGWMDVNVVTGKGKPILETKDFRRECYDKSHDSYDLNSSKDIVTNQEIYSSRLESVIYDKVEKSTSKNEVNSLYERGNKCKRKEKLYEDYFKNADRIYSIAQENPYSERSCRFETDKTNDFQEQSFLQKSNKNDIYQLNQKNCTDSITSGGRRSRGQGKTSSGKRVSRMVTMDKPMKKQLSDSTLNLNLSGYNQPKVRKNSRAGSEPPISKSEDALNILQETRLKRSQSDAEVDRGDLMTRVELPRRGSFLNPGSARRPNSIKGGTPLGFSELFDEFRNQEGLTSVDDILAAIIGNRSRSITNAKSTAIDNIVTSRSALDPEGMSFNDLKPLYKEFLLKLAATLTQDELYQRSASIMKRRRRPQRRRSSRRSCLLGKAIKRSVSKLKGGPTEFTSVLFPAKRLNDSFGSSSSCDARNNHKNQILTDRLTKRKTSWRRKKTVGCHTTSEGSDTCRRLSRTTGPAANRSSSGYVSCSECSYDSESCTCVSADKCYCSLSRIVSSQSRVPPNTVVCGCDTDSCSESNKCYCARQPVQPTVLEQLRQRGIVLPGNSLNLPGSVVRAETSNTGKSRTASHGLDVLKKHSSSSYGSVNNLALDYDLFNPGRRSQQSSDGEKVLVVSARDTQGRLVYVGGADRDKKCRSQHFNRSQAHHEALSIKKSAEIAAIFGGDSSRVGRRVSNASSIRSSVSLEAGLGYLP